LAPARVESEDTTPDKVEKEHPTKLPWVGLPFTPKPLKKSDPSKPAVKSKCNCINLSPEWIKELEGAQGEDLEFDRVVAHLKIALKSEKAWMCNMHIKIAGAHLCLRQMERSRMDTRIRKCCEFKGEHVILRTQNETFGWFVQSDYYTEIRQKASLGGLRFKPLASKTGLKSELNWSNLKMMTGQELNLFKIHGATTTSGIKISKKLADLVREEFRMYAYHDRWSKEGKGHTTTILKTMYFSVIQQYVRQHPMVYLKVLQMRGDKNFQLISYPHYSYYSPHGVQSHYDFLECDLRGTLEDQTGKMKARVKDYVKIDDCKNMNYIRNHFGTNYGKAKYAKHPHRQDKHYFDLTGVHDGGKLDWEKTNLRHGDICVLAPTTSFRIMTTTDSEMMGVTACLVALSKTVPEELEGGAKVSEICDSHRKMVPPPSPRYEENYGSFHVPGKCLFSVALRGLGDVSDALVGRVEWSDPAPQAELKLLLEQTSEQRRKYIDTWEKKATKLAIDALNVSFKLEREAYGIKSYFHLDNGKIETIADPDVNAKLAKLEEARLREQVLKRSLKKEAGDEDNQPLSSEHVNEGEEDDLVIAQLLKDMDDAVEVASGQTSVATPSTSGVLPQTTPAVTPSTGEPQSSSSGPVARSARTRGKRKAGLIEASGNASDTVLEATPSKKPRTTATKKKGRKKTNQSAPKRKSARAKAKATLEETIPEVEHQVTEADPGREEESDDEGDDRTLRREETPLRNEERGGDEDEVMGNSRGGEDGEYYVVESEEE
jgi:hypothetical protein